MKKYLLLGAVVCMLGVLAGGIYIFHMRQSTDIAAVFAAAATGSMLQQATTTPLLPPRQAPAGSTEYRNTTYRFSLFYTNNLQVASYDEGGGASTITFQDVSVAEGFQIFVVPYRETQVTTQRFKQDEPSGVMELPKNITIDGAVASSFYSTDAVLGDTAEIWFIHGGYLFEVTAPKEDASWLSQIMLTWQFL